MTEPSVSTDDLQDDLTLRLLPVEAEALAHCVDFTAKKSAFGQWSLWQAAATGKAKLDAALSQTTKDGEG